MLYVAYNFQHSNGDYGSGCGVFDKTSPRNKAEVDTLIVYIKDAVPVKYKSVIPVFWKELDD